MRIYTTSLLNKYVKKRNEVDKIKGVTISKELQSFTNLWKYAVESGIVSGESPAYKAQKIKDSEAREFLVLSDVENRIKDGTIKEDEQEEFLDAIILEPDDIIELLEHVKDCPQTAKHPFIYPMIAIPALTGCRRGEILKSRRSDIEFANGHIRIRDTKKNKSASLSFRRLPIHEKLHDILKEWLEFAPDSPFTVCTSKGEPLTKCMADHHFGMALRGSRFEKLKGFHALRHSFISILAMQWIAPAIVQSWVGHVDEKTTRRCTHLIPKSSIQAMQRLNTII